jgi:hypothetical protein
MNKKYRWQRFQKVGESLPRGVRGVDYTKQVLSIQNIMKQAF